MTWPTTPARFVLTEVDERGLRPGEDGELLSVSEYRGVVPRATSASQQAASEDTSRYKRCEPGQLVLNRLWAFRGGLGVSPLTGLVSPDYAVFDIDPSMDPRFVHYQTRSAWFVAEMTKRLRGIGSPDASNGRAPRINTDDLGRIHMFTPPLEVQRKLCDRIDAEVRRIDRVLSQNHALLHRLQDRMQSSRHEVLARISHRVPLRFAAREIGETGEAPIRDVLTLDRVESWTGKVVPFNGTEEAGTPITSGKAFQTGDVLYSKLRPYLAKAVLATDAGVANAEFIVYRPTAGVESTYLHHVLLSPSFVSWTNAMSFGTKMPRTNSELMGRYSIPLPDLPTQKRLATELSVVRHRLDNLSDRIREQRNLIEQRRRSLLTAAVTGQLAA